MLPVPPPLLKGARVKKPTDSISLSPSVLLCPFLPVKTQISHVRSSFYTDSSALSPASSLPLQECIDGGERARERNCGAVRRGIQFDPVS